MNLRGSQDLELVKCVCSSFQGLIKLKSMTCGISSLKALFIYFKENISAPW